MSTKTKKIGLALMMACILNACTPTAMISATKTTIPTPTHIPPTSDTIYFWWHKKGTSQLWEVAPNGDSEILYELPSILSIRDAVNAKLLTENGAQTLKQYAANDQNSPNSGQGEINLQLHPNSLQISPDRKRLVWNEGINYCNSYGDLFMCEGETIVRVFNLETKQVESEINVPIEREFLDHPVWSLDSQKLAYDTRQRESRKNTIHIFNIATNETISYERSGDFSWTPNSQNIIVSDINGFYILSLDTQQTRHILDGQWWISDFEISPDGNTLIFTGIKDFDDPTTSYFDDRVNPKYQLIYKLDLKTNSVQPIMNENKSDWIENLHWLLDGEHIIYTQRTFYPSHQIFIRKAVTGEIVFMENTSLDVDSNWQISQDGKKLLFVGRQHGEMFLLLIYDLTKKEWNKVSLPHEIQAMMDKNLEEGKHRMQYRLSLATW